MISEISKLNLELHHVSSDWSLYLMDDSNSGKVLHEVAYSDTTRGMWNVLRGIYETLAILECQQQQKQEEEREEKEGLSSSSKT